MRDFIKNALTNARNKKLKRFDYKYKCDNGEVIFMKGTIDHGNAYFIIERIKTNGHQCSKIPVSQMPLTDKCINQIAEIAVENL